MKQPDKCPNCPEGELSSWKKGQEIRRCVSCGYWEARDGNVKPNVSVEKES